MIRIPVTRLTQAGATLYVGHMKASDLITIGVIDTWNPEMGWDMETQGYQRASDEAHFHKIAVFLENNPDALLPTSILLSARTEEQGVLNFIPVDGNQDLGYLEIPESLLRKPLLTGKLR